MQRGETETETERVRQRERERERHLLVGKDVGFDDQGGVVHQRRAEGHGQDEGAPRHHESLRDVCKYNS